jgi:ABC-2 type transport system ATP-binding protein
VIIEARNLGYRYGKNTALDGLSFAIEQGSCCGVLGPNGCGKSTLFRILAALLEPQEGEVRIAGLPADKARERCGVVFQASSLDRRMTVEENLLTQGSLYGMGGRSLRHRTDEMLARFHLSERRRDEAGTLSGGWMRRVEIAKALLHSPTVLLLDEATAGLDPGARLELWELLEEARKTKGLTILFTTHLLDEADRAQSLLLMFQGRTAAQGTPAELKRRIGGEVLVVEPRDGDEVEHWLRAQAGVEVRRIQAEIRVETPSAARLLAGLSDALPGAVLAAHIHGPTLEDVFLRETGARLDD